MTSPCNFASIRLEVANIIFQLAESRFRQAELTFQTATAEAMSTRSQFPDNTPAILAALNRASNTWQAVQVADTARRNAFNYRLTVAEQVITSELMQGCIGSFDTVEEVD